VSMPMTSDQITAKAWEMVGESFRRAIGQERYGHRTKRTKR
jgi:hypothetical protein